MHFLSAIDQSKARAKLLMQRICIITCYLKPAALHHAQSAPRVGTTAEDVTPADHIIALAIGLAFCIEAFSVCTPKKGRCSNNQRSPAGQPSGFPVPPTV